MGYGSGHTMAGAALQHAFEVANPDVEAVQLDGIRDTPSPLERFTASFYIYTNKRAHWLWRAMYYWPVFRSRIASWLAEWFFSREDGRKILAMEPDAVVATHFWSAKVAGRMGLPFFTVITDYVFHPFWLCRKASAYFVASEEIVGHLIDAGFPKDRIHLTGIPVRSMFWERPSIAEARREMNLEPKDKVVLLLSGNHGVTPVMDIALGIKDTGATVLMAAGKNKRLQKAMTEFMRSHNIKGRVLGFVDHMNMLLRASDVVVTKAGGIISSECLAMATPVVFFDSLPGQEEGNARVISEWGAATRAHDVHDAINAVKELLQNPERLMEMRQAALLHGKPKASLNIARKILEYLQ